MSLKAGRGSDSKKKEKKKKAYMVVVRSSQHLAGVETHSSLTVSNSIPAQRVREKRRGEEKKRRR